MQIVLGSHNKKKLFELDLLLRSLGFHLKTLSDFDNAVSVDETGTSFAENAALKATVQAKNLNEWVIGEDSGLSVEALDGRPGVFSSRYAGEDGNDEANNQKLLEELKGFPRDRRAAHYTSHIALSNPQGVVVVSCEDRCRGLIGIEPKGDTGFGYDPLFIIPEYDQTFAQLGDTIKSVLSHRARAIRHFVPKLLQLAKLQQTPA